MLQRSGNLTTLLGLTFCLLSLPLLGQVIFRSPSPIKRHGVTNGGGIQANGLGDKFSTDSDSTGPTWRSNELAENTMSQYDSVAQKSTALRDGTDDAGTRRPDRFTVTYMGAPVERDTSAASKYRLLPPGFPPIRSAETNLTRFHTSGPDRPHQQDSLMVAMLEDSLRRVIDQITPLRSASQIAPQSAFNLFRTVPSILPVRLSSLREFRISSAYGSRIHPISGRVHHHAGIDLPQPRWTPVYATADGVVDRILWQPGGIGLAIYIVHQSGYQTGYGHLEDHSVLVGESVRRGQVIGRVGSTGLSTGPHLHYTVLAGTVPVDPASYCFLLLNALNEPKTVRRQTGNPKKG